VRAPSADHHIISLITMIDLHAGIVDIPFLKGKERKEQLPWREVEERLESVLNQPEYKLQQHFFPFHRFFYCTYWHYVMHFRRNL
jgi:hypothetical protein